MHTEPHPLTRKWVTIKPGVGNQPVIHNTMHDVTGAPFEVEGWQDALFGKSWMDCEGNPAALVYAMRSAFAELPTNDDVVYGHVNGLGMMLHSSELGEVIEAPKERV